MRTKTWLLGVLFPLMAACSVTEGDDGRDGARGPLGKADTVSGSCVGDGEDFCGGQSDGACWCDAGCAQYGDCCADAPSACDVDQCSWTDDGESMGCADGQTCMPGLCLHFCTPDTPNCCGPNSCVDIPEPPAPGCEPQDAHGQGLCEAFFGYAWNGSSCVGLSGCSCVGSDCGNTTFDVAQCEAAHAQCGDPEPPECQPVLCALFCEHGFKTDEDGCDVCDCADPPPPPPPTGGSCEDNCGGAAADHSCYCDDQCESFGDCCDDFDAACGTDDREPASGFCIKNSQDACETDADCISGGCGGELCFNPAVSNGISTCECTQPQDVGCGCVAGQCTWFN